MEEEIKNNFQNTSEANNDIVMQGKILYRYGIDQYELEGKWGIINENNFETFAYLYNKPTKKIVFPVNKLDILSDNRDCLEKMGNNFLLNISTANLHEVLLIPNEYLFKTVLQFLSGEYQGYFVYFGKTIEDKFLLNYELENGVIKISGTGSNNLGSFYLIGYVNFLTSKGKLNNFF